MYTNIPSMLEGEIVSVQSLSKVKKKNFVRYTCLVDMPDGSTALVPNCKASTLFGGIDDYFQSRLRASIDQAPIRPSASDDANNARTGTRVYIMFVGGNMANPVIIGFAQHPNQTQEFDNPEKDKPSSVLKYNGMRFDIDDDGTFRATHFGAPEVKYVDSSSLLGAATATLGTAASSLSGDSSIDPDKTNSAIVPAAASRRTFFEFQKDGGVLVRDSLDQVLDLNTKDKRIYIANNDKKGALSGSSGPDTEFFLMDKDKMMVHLSARKLVTITSDDERKDITKGNYSHEVSGKEKIKIVGDKEDAIEGAWTATVKGKFTHKISGTYELTTQGAYKEEIKQSKSIVATGAYSVESKEKIAMKVGSATLNMSAGKVSFGVGSVEVLKTISDGLMLLSDTLKAISTMTVGTSTGPSSQPINLADFTKIMTDTMKLKALLDGITG